MINKKRLNELIECREKLKILTSPLVTHRIFHCPDLVLALRVRPRILSLPSCLLKPLNITSKLLGIPPNITVNNGFHPHPSVMAEIVGLGIESVSSLAEPLCTILQIKSIFILLLYGM